MNEHQPTTGYHDAATPPLSGRLERMSDAIDRSRFAPLVDAINRAILARPFVMIFGVPIVGSALGLLLRWVLR